MSHSEDLILIAKAVDADLTGYRDYIDAVRGAEMRLRKLIEGLPNSTSGKLTAELRNIHDILSFKP